MKAPTHIALWMALAVPAQAEAPALCNGDIVEGWILNAADQSGNGFVEYFSFRNNGEERRIYLEHCASGTVMRAEYKAHWSQPDKVDAHYAARIRSKAPVTQKQLAKELENLGADTLIWKSNHVSCACHNLFPDAQGDKTAYTGEWR